MKPPLLNLINLAQNCLFDITTVYNSYHRNKTVTTQYFTGRIISPSLNLINFAQNCSFNINAVLPSSCNHFGNEKIWLKKKKEETTVPFRSGA